MAIRIRTWIPPLVKGVVTVGLIGLLAKNVDIGRMFDHLKETDPWLFLTGIAVMAVQAVLAAWRWNLVLHFKRIAIEFPKLVRFLWLGLFFNQILPSTVGGDAVRGYSLVREGCSLGVASVAVLVDRVMGISGLILLVVITSPLSFKYLPDGAARSGVLLVVACALFGLVLLILLDRVATRFLQWRFARGLTAVSREARHLLFGKGPGLQVLGLSMVIQLLSVVAIAILAIAARIDVAFDALILVLPIATLLMTIPLSVAGWGVREGVMVVGLGYASVSPERAMALSVLYGILLLVVALPGGLAWAFDGRKRRNNDCGRV